MKTYSNRLSILKASNAENLKNFKPQFFRLFKKTDEQAFDSLLNNKSPFVSDYIEDQLKEYIKYKNPKKKFTSDELVLEIKKHIGNTEIKDYGVWVYYSWSNRLVHILDEEEFVQVRTSRNQYKITPEEKAILVEKKIGVIGLSVGQSVSVTLAMERICGELRLADFDLLELTNLNRIRTGIHNLGLLKVYSVAREIAEIDPFIKVVCFPEGLTQENMETFFTDGGNLDLLVEESDGFDIKILCRHKARELGIPVIMEASDRCMVDVERFDLEPKRDILHGLVNHLDIDTLKKLKTNEEKIPYMLDVLGIETASVRLKASMLEIEQTINTWPQLASAVTMGGGITADVSRRILLNQFTDSGRYYVDIEEIIGNKPKSENNLQNEAALNAFDFAEAATKVNVQKRVGSIQLEESKVKELVELACKAPSGGNSQPWRWIYKDSCLLLFNPYLPNLSTLDFDGRASQVAIGAALENLEIATTKHGLSIEINLNCEKALSSLVATIYFFEKKNVSTQIETLYQAINYRITNRQLGQREYIEDELLAQLKNQASMFEDAQVKFFTEPDALNEIGEVLGELEKIRILDERSHLDFVNEIRWTEEENERKRDGVDLATLDITNAERAGLQISRNKNVIGLVDKWQGGGAFKKLTKKSIDSASAVGVISMSQSDAEQYINGGRLLQKIWLKANANDISFQPMSASLFMYIRLYRGNGEGYSKQTIERLNKIRPEFERVFGFNKSLQEIFIFRLSKSGKPKVVSLRKPIEEMFRYL